MYALFTRLGRARPDDRGWTVRVPVARPSRLGPRTMAAPGRCGALRRRPARRPCLPVRPWGGRSAMTRHGSRRPGRCSRPSPTAPTLLRYSCARLTGAPDGGWPNGRAPAPAGVPRCWRPAAGTTAGCSKGAPPFAWVSSAVPYCSKVPTGAAPGGRSRSLRRSRGGPASLHARRPSTRVPRGCQPERASGVRRTVGPLGCVSRGRECPGRRHRSASVHRCGRPWSL